jgi:pyrroloquinoline quinone (PQQ) biosynthesis protein C
LAVSEDDPTGGKSRRHEPTLSAIEDLPKALAVIFEEHRPSRMPFFQRLAGLPRAVARDPALLGQIHLVYQSAMHATRAAVYYLPHLDSPALRKRKLQIFIDDDGLADGDTHHYQLTRAFRSIGAECLLDDEEFGELSELCHYLEAETAEFVRLAPKLYSRSLGAWCAVEMLSADWMRALGDALSVHFPHFRREPYFEECFSHQVEERHAAEALEVTQIVLRARPELLDEILRDARIIAEALDGVWAHLDRIVREAQAAMVPDGTITVRREPGTRDPAPATAQDAALVPSPAGQAAKVWLAENQSGFGLV